MAVKSLFKIAINGGKERNFGLDMVRSAAIGLVLISHGRGLLFDFQGKILLANGGYFGVEIFWLSVG